MPSPKVTVLLPFRDAVKTIRRSVESILNQTFQDFELILINDGSTDGSREVVDNMPDERIRIIDLPSSGMVTALNEGIYLSKADYIALIDPYDLSRSDRLQKQIKYLDQNRDTAVISSAVSYVLESPGKNIESYIQWSNTILGNEEIFHKRFVNSTVINSTIIFRKELVTAYGVFENGEFPEDYEIFLRWMDKGARFEKLPEELTEWHDDLQRLSRRHIKYNSSAASKIRAKYFKSWLKLYFRRQPELFLWGANHSNLKRADSLVQEGLKISGYIDMEDNQSGTFEDYPVFNINQIPSRVMIICFVDQYEPGDIPDILTRKGLEEGTHFILMS